MRNAKELKRIEAEETCLKKLASVFIDIALDLIEAGDLEEFEDLEPLEVDVIPGAKHSAISNTRP